MNWFELNLATAEVISIFFWLSFSFGCNFTMNISISLTHLQPMLYSYRSQQLISNANQLIGFYVSRALAGNEFISQFYFGVIHEITQYM